MFDPLPVEVIYAWLSYAGAILGGAALGLIWATIETMWSKGR